MMEGGVSMGELGSMSRINLSSQDRRLARIPPSATHQMWVYPLTGMAQLPEELLRSPGLLTDPVHYLVVYGGFFYLQVEDEEVGKVGTSSAFRGASGFRGGGCSGGGGSGSSPQLQTQPPTRRQTVVSASTIAPAHDELAAGMYFHPPIPWDRALTNQLNQAGRFQDVTISTLRDVGGPGLGAKYYCWLHPAEELPLPVPTATALASGASAGVVLGTRGSTGDGAISETTSYRWRAPKHGAFVYLFDSNKDPDPRDIIFPVWGVATDDDNDNDSGVGGDGDGDGDGNNRENEDDLSGYYIF